MATITAIVATVVPGVALADAWVGAKGSANVHLDYSFRKTADLVLPEEDWANFEAYGLTNGEFPKYSDLSNTLVLTGSYVPLDNLEANFKAVYVSNRHIGAPSHLGFLDALGLSNTDTHDHAVSALQDMTIGARYAIGLDPFSIAPSVGLTIPLTDYPVLGNAAPGRGLKQLELGVSAGVSLNEYVSGLMLEIGAIHHMVSDVEGWEEMGNDYTDVTLQASYLVTEKWSIAGLGVFNEGHGAFSAGSLARTYVPQYFTSDIEKFKSLMSHHDQLLDYTSWSVGFGTAYRITPNFAVNLGALFSVKVRYLPPSQNYNFGVTYSI